MSEDTGAPTRRDGWVDVGLAVLVGAVSCGVLLVGFDPGFNRVVCPVLIGLSAIRAVRGLFRLRGLDRST